MTVSTYFTVTFVLLLVVMMIVNLYLLLWIPKFLTSPMMNIDM